MLDLRTDPRLSVNKLAEYMYATPIRRRRIIEDQIKVVAYKAARYTKSRNAIVRYLTRPNQNVHGLLREALELRDRVPTLPEDDDGRKYLMDSARAIESFALMAGEVKSKKFVTRPGGRDAHLMLSGLRVAVTPEVVLLEKATERYVGARKFHFSKTYPLKTEGLRDVACIIYAHLQEQGFDPIATQCVAVNVWTRTLEHAPSRRTNRMRSITFAAQEIVGMWPVVMEAVRERIAEEE